MMNRREIITTVAALTVAVAAPVAHGARAEKTKPQIGDVLVHAFGARAGILIKPMEVRDERIFAFPMATNGLVRDGSLHNQLSLLRVDEVAMSEKTRRYAAGSILAVSAACTHTGCEVSGWQRDTFELICPCHGSRFAVLDAARAVLGPATKPLALLPIEQGGGVIRVAGKFSRRVGPAPTY